LICGAIVFVNHAEFLGKPEETFRMADEEITGWIETVIKLFDEALLLGFVEIDHDVAAENDVVAAGEKFGFEIVEVELNEFL